MTPCLATSDRANAGLRRAAQLAGLKQGPPGDESVRPWPVSRRQGKRSGETPEIGKFALVFQRDGWPKVIDWLPISFELDCHE